MSGAQATILIPARYGSTRFPGKPLVDLHGKPVILWVAEKAKQAAPQAEVVVATDDQRIFDVVKKAGIRVVMTRADHPSGSDRLQEAATILELAADDLIVNVQGDEPQVRSAWIRALIQPFLKDRHLQMATLAHPLSPEEVGNPNAVKVLVDQNSHAIYFTRFAAPFSRQTFEQLGQGPVLKHMGFYSYRKSFLDRFCQTPPGYFEQGESLEQLRALQMGEKIFVTQVEGRSQGVDTPEDLEKLKAIWGHE